MNKGASGDSIFRPAFMLMAGRAVGFVVAFAIPIVLVRVFSQSEFGTYKQLFLIYTTLYAIAQVGMAESLYYFLPGGSKDAGRYVSNALLALSLAGLACIGGLWGLSGYLGRWLNNPGLAPYIPLVGLYLLFMLAATVLEIGMTARKRHLHAFCAYALSDLSRAGLCILPVLMFGGLTALMLGSVAFAALRLGATVWYMRGEFAGETRPDAALLKQQLAYALPFAMAILIDSLQSNLHMYVVSYHFDAATFAIYSVGCLQVPMVDFMMTSTSSVMMVRMREHLHADDHDAVLTLWNDTTRKLALVFIPLVGVLLVTAGKLIEFLFTDRYADSAPLFMVWSTTILLTALMTDSILRVYAETRYLIFMNLVKLIFIACTINWALSAMGRVMRAVLVTLTAMLLAKLLALARVSVLLQSGVARLLPWTALFRTAFIAVLAALPCFMLERVMRLPALPSLMILGFVYTAAYAMLLLAYGPLSAAERRSLLQWAQVPAAWVTGSRRA